MRPVTDPVAGWASSCVVMCEQQRGVHAPGLEVCLSKSVRTAILWTVLGMSGSENYSGCSVLQLVEKVVLGNDSIVYA
jgi:hypothetical protein